MGDGGGRGESGWEGVLGRHSGDRGSSARPVPIRPDDAGARFAWNNGMGGTDMHPAQVFYQSESLTRVCAAVAADRKGQEVAAGRGKELAAWLLRGREGFEPQQCL